MIESILQLDHVNKKFGGLQVIRDISVEVAKGSRTALIGPNGAGKTTLFNLISGVYPVDEGSIVLDGVDITHVPVQNRIVHGVSRSFQNVRLMPHLSTLENVMLGQHSRARSLKDLAFPIGLIPRNRWVEQARAALADAGLELFPGQVVANLPFGIQKRIEVVRAMISDPSLLLLDEPAAGLNPKETEALQGLLEKVSGKGCTLFVVEHDMNFVRDLCDQVVVLNFGEKIYDGSASEMRGNQDVLEAYLGKDTAFSGAAEA